MHNKVTHPSQLLQVSNSELLPLDLVVAAGRVVFDRDAEGVPQPPFRGVSMPSDYSEYELLSVEVDRRVAIAGEALVHATVRHRERELARVEMVRIDVDACDMYF